MFKIEKEVRQCCLLSLCLFVRNDRLDELQDVIKIGERNINSLACVDDTTLMAESKEKVKNLLMRVKEETERACLRLVS